jgi:hypothetical protein
MRTTNTFPIVRVNFYVLYGHWCVDTGEETEVHNIQVFLFKEKN